MMERLPVYVRLRPTESEHSIRSVDNGKKANDVKGV